MKNDFNKAKTIGEIGENSIFNYISNNGWKIKFRNLRIKFDEIDIVAIASDNTLVFCEVKARFVIDSPNAAIRPEDNLTMAKLKKITRACQLFVGKYQELVDEEKGWRIDLFAVDIGINGVIRDIRHYENI